MKDMMDRLMANKYWELLHMKPGGNSILHIMAAARGGEEPFNFADQFLRLVMMGFYPLSYAILEGFRILEELAPTEEIRRQACFFIEVEEGKHAASGWYKDILHSELYRRMFNSLAEEPLIVDKGLLNAYLGSLKLREGGLPRALVTVGFIEKTGLEVLRLLHDFIAQWQVLTGIPTAQIDLTYLNEHMLHEGEESADQHVSLINRLLIDCGGTLDGEIDHFEEVTAHWFNHVHELATEGILRSR